MQPSTIPDNVPAVVPPAALVLGTQIGAGAFGTVFSATLHGQPVAVKRVVEDRRDTSREASLCQQLSAASHPNIVQFICVERTEGLDGVGVLHIVTERANHSLRDMLTWLARRQLRMTKLNECLFFPQLAAGLAFLHARNIVHRDIRPENVSHCIHQPSSIHPPLGLDSIQHRCLFVPTQGS